jgi:hypothetical protein
MLQVCTGLGKASPQLKCLRASRQFDPRDEPLRFGAPECGGE